MTYRARDAPWRQSSHHWWWNLCSDDPSQVPTHKVTVPIRSVIFFDSSLSLRQIDLERAPEDTPSHWRDLYLGNRARWGVENTLKPYQSTILHLSIMESRRSAPSSWYRYLVRESEGKSNVCFPRILDLGVEMAASTTTQQQQQPTTQALNNAFPDNQNELASNNLNSTPTGHQQQQDLHSNCNTSLSAHTIPSQHSLANNRHEIWGSYRLWFIN